MQYILILIPRCLKLCLKCNILLKCSAMKRSNLDQNQVVGWIDICIIKTGNTKLYVCNTFFFSKVCYTTVLKLCYCRRIQVASTIYKHDYIKMLTRGMFVNVITLHNVIAVSCRNNKCWLELYKVQYQIQCNCSELLKRISFIIWSLLIML